MGIVSDRTQHVQIYHFVTDFANIISGVPHGSVWGHIFSLFIASIMKYQKISCQVYTDHIQICISFPLSKQPLERVGGHSTALM